MLLFDYFSSQQGFNMARRNVTTCQEQNYQKRTR